jgi:uncharacterized protein
MTAAVLVLREAGAALVFHCGDVGGRHVLDEMREIESAFVWGDTDKDRMGLLRHAQRIGVACYGVLADIELDGKRIAVLHGDDKKLLQRLISEQQHDFIIWGHGAEGEDRTVGKTRIIHPGSLFGAKIRTLAVIDLEASTVGVVTV